MNIRLKSGGGLAVTGVALAVLLACSRQGDEWSPGPDSGSLTGHESDSVGVKVLKAAEALEQSAGAATADWQRFVAQCADSPVAIDRARNLQLAIRAECSGQRDVWQFTEAYENIGTVWVIMAGMLLLADQQSLEAAVWGEFLSEVLRVGNLREIEVVLAGLVELRQTVSAEVWRDVRNQMVLTDQWLAELFERELIAAKRLPVWHGYDGPIDDRRRGALIDGWRRRIEDARARDLSAVAFLEAVRGEDLFGVEWGLRVATDPLLISKIQQDIITGIVLPE